jgi:S1-C subfamily serine protease
MKKLTSRTLLGFTIFLSQHLAAASLSEVVTLNRPSVVYLQVEKASDVTGAVTQQGGTGFIVNTDGFVITAAHVVAGAAGVQVDVRGATGSREGTLEGLEVLYENSSFDVAVLRFKNTAITRHPISLGDPWKVPEGATVYAMGFPGTEEWFYTEGKLAGKGPKGSWNTTIVLNPGMSGGPIFNTDGKVVAMVWGGVNTPEITGINRVLPVTLLADALKVAGALSPTQTSAVDIPVQGIEQPYKIDITQESLGGLSPVTKPYRQVFNAKPGFQITDFQLVSKSANNASSPSVSLSPDKTSITVDFKLTSGPAYDRWRGWLDGELLTRQIEMAEPSTK